MMMLVRVVVLAALPAALALQVASDFKPIDTDPCPFGYGTGCSGGAKMTSGQRDQVAKILGGILKNLSGKKALVQDTKVISKVSLAKGTADFKPIDTDPCPFGYGAGCSGGARMTSGQRDQVAKILGGILKNLSGKKGAAALGQILARSPDVGCSEGSQDFGYCGGSSDHSPIDTQTKAQVATILEGILNNLSKQK